MPQPSRRVGCRRLRLEHLEDRTLLTAGQPAPLIDPSGLQVDSRSFSSSHILVQFGPNDSPVALEGTSLGRAYPSAGLYQVELLPGTSVQQALSRYTSDPRVKTAEPDYDLIPTWLPNDPLFAN